MQNHPSDLATVQLRLGVLESKVEALTKEFELLGAMMVSSRRRVLIAEVAFVLDRVASEFVMMGETAGFTFTVGELKSMAEDRELETEQLERWEHFCGFLRRRGWALGKLCAQGRLLKELRRGDEHATPEEAAVSMADLIKWVGEEPLVTAPVEYQKFLDLVSEFSKVGTPLLPMADVSAVVDAP